MARSSVFIIGAGVAGLACARALSGAGFDVRLADKGRGPGGRCSTRRSDHGRFDHGAPFFTASDPRFLGQVQAWIKAGVVAPWKGTFRDPNETLSGQELYLGAPAMNAFIRYEAEALGAEYGVQLGRPVSKPGGFDLYRADGELCGDADTVVIATPAPQAVALLPDGSRLQERAASAQMHPCWTLMAAFEEGSLAPGYDMEIFSAGPLEKVIWQAGRPGREPGLRLVAHATAAWALDHLEEDADTVASALDAALDLGVSPIHLTAHRWRYARASQAEGPRFGFDRGAGLAVCGDWHAGPTIEDAWLSGHELGHHLIQELG